jgi:hypothetical protein
MVSFSYHHATTMMPRVLLFALTVCVRATAAHAAAPGAPSIGYVYPAGARQGADIEIMVGGQNVRNATAAYVSGAGVTASIVGRLGPLGNEQRKELQRRLFQLLRQRLAAAPGAARRPALPARRARQPADKPQAEDAQPVPLPDHPLLRDLESKSIGELYEVARRFLVMRAIQPTPAAISQLVVLQIEVAPDAPPGERELRLLTPNGVSNPLRFEVGLLPEVSEQEPNGPLAGPRVPQMQMLPIETPAPTQVDVPVVLNGQIMPGDADRFRFSARQGQNLVITAQARELMPYLADAVPGWFQAMLTLYDATGAEVACADHYRFHPDPVLFYKVPQDGEYTIEIRDTIYRGREDFVYRVTIGEQPFITHVFPLGGQGRGASPAAHRPQAAITGWNLPAKGLSLDMQPGASHIRQVEWHGQKWLSNSIPYAVDDLPQADEAEPNDAAAKAQALTLPRIVNGRISRPGDSDWFRFEGRADEQVVAEVYARRLDSPLDSLLRLTDAEGRVIAANDDCPDKETGLLTHQADSYLSVRLPRDGVYYVRLSDVEGHGDDEYAYRLRIGSPRPDFSLCVTPSGVSFAPTGVAVLRVHVFRRDGFDGEIEVALKDAPAGLTLSGGRIPRGRESACMTLAAPAGQPARRPGRGRPFSVQLEGRALIGGATVTRPVMPAEDMMQAFAYLHLVPAQELVANIGRVAGAGVQVELPEAGALRVPVGGAVPVRVKAPPSPMLEQVRLALSDPPKGVSLGPVSATADGMTFTVQADRQAAPVGYQDNLIVAAFAEVEVAPAGAKAVPAGGKTAPSGSQAAPQKRRVALGTLPAIPFEIVR